MTDAVHHYRDFTITAVPCAVRGSGWRVEDAAGRVVIHHVGTLSLAQSIVDARLTYCPTPTDANLERDGVMRDE